MEQENKQEENDDLHVCKCMNEKCLFCWETNKPQMIINNNCPRCGSLQVRKEKVGERHRRSNFERDY